MTDRLRVLHNIQILNGKIVVFRPPQADTKSCDARFKISGPDGIPSEVGSMSVGRARKITKIAWTNSAELFPPSTCTQMYEGTLHIQNKHLPHVLFHVLNDNILPILALVLLDAYFYPQHAFGPRWLLRVEGNIQALPHHDQILGKALNGIPDLKQLEGACFRRVLWGKPFTPYHSHMFPALRRQRYRSTRAASFETLAFKTELIECLMRTVGP